jgi:DNA-binding beta-propeller fold protein YncE
MKMLGVIMLACITVLGATSAWAGEPGPTAPPFRLVEKLTGFKAPTGLAVDASGTIYVSNWSNGTVVKVDAAGQQQVFVDDVGSPAGLAFNSQGHLYIADYSGDTIYVTDQKGSKTVFATGLKTPTGISFNSLGELLVANRSGNEIIKLSRDGRTTVMATGLKTPVGVVEDADGTLYVTNYNGGVSRIKPGGQPEIISEDFSTPGIGIEIDMQGNLFAVDNGDGSLKKITSNGSTLTVIDNMGGMVGLKITGKSLYLTSWDEGAVYKFEMP